MIEDSERVWREFWLTTNWLVFEIHKSKRQSAKLDETPQSSTDFEILKLEKDLNELKGFHKFKPIFENKPDQNANKIIGL